MRHYIAAILLFCCLACSRLAGPSGNSEVSEWSFEPGRVEVPDVPPCPRKVLPSAAAKRALEEVWELGSQFAEDPSTHVVSMPSWASSGYASRLVQVVTDNPESTSALTARLEAAQILMRSSDEARRSRARQIFQDIATTHPERWQATLAAQSLISRLINEDVSVVTSLEAEIEQLVARLKSLEQELPAEYRLWREHVLARPTYDLCAGFYTGVMIWALEQDNLNTAKRFGERLVNEYPGYWYNREVKIKLEAIAQGRNPNKRPPLEY